MLSSCIAYVANGQVNDTCTMCPSNTWGRMGGQAGGARIEGREGGARGGARGDRQACGMTRGGREGLVVAGRHEGWTASLRGRGEGLGVADRHGG